MKPAFEDMNLQIPAVTAEPEDYTGEDGLLYCGKCRTPKEAFFPADKIALFGRERLASLFISHLLQFIPERLATPNPTHEMIHGRAWHTLGKVHQSQFLLRIRTVYKIFHNLNFLIICLSAPCSRKVQQPLKDSIR